MEIKEELIDRKNEERVYWKMGVEGSSDSLMPIIHIMWKGLVRPE